MPAPLHSAPANVMPVYENLRRTESAHFIYIYQVSLAPQVPALIRLCEGAYDLLTPALHWTPHGKTIILYADAMDEHNGAAWVHPRPTILLYAASFELNLSLTRFRYAQMAPGLGLVYAFNRKDPNPGASDDDAQNQKLQLYLSIKAVVNF
ncbi:MAG: hypothetical protein ABIJ53_06975 [Verrucomicrobiota bacterium]